MTTIHVEEKTLALALVKAAGKLGITQSEMDHKIVTESAGFLGIFGKKIALEAWKKGTQSKSHSRKNGRKNTGRRTNRKESYASAPTEERVPLTDSEVLALKEELTEFCAGICSRIVDETVKVSFSTENDRLILNVENDQLATHIAKNTKLAEALEHILRKKPRRLRRELPFRIFVDCNNIRKDREIELVQMASDLSLKVSENKRPVVLNYKSSYDRKIIHMALDQDDKVYTKSIGSGPNRKLMILPTDTEGAENLEAEVYQ
jgi:spoIIIJ-associated protein